MKEEIRWFWKTDLNGRKTQEEEESEEKVLALNSLENKRRNKKGKFIKVICHKCGKYGHHRWELPVNYLIFNMVMVIYHYNNQ